MQVSWVSALMCSLRAAMTQLDGGARKQKENGPLLFSFTGTKGSQRK